MDYIVILDRLSATPLTVRYVLRANVPAARQSYYADPDKTSAYASASVSDLSALRAGQVVERTNTVTFTGMTVAQMKTALEAEQASFQASVTADSPEWNPFKFYGTAWDGTAWTTRGVN